MSKITFDMIAFEKGNEYSPYSDRANRYGIKTFWRATLGFETIAIADTKKECVSSARNYIRRMNEQQN